MAGGEGRKVGELAAATGLTVRTLHYYEEVGLLVASGRTEAGHRLYDDAEVERLYRICLLRHLGLPDRSDSLPLPLRPRTEPRRHRCQT
jgi:hypothetical protein